MELISNAVSVFMFGGEFAARIQRGLPPGYDNSDLNVFYIYIFFFKFFELVFSERPIAVLPIIRSRPSPRRYLCGFRNLSMNSIFPRRLLSVNPSGKSPPPRRQCKRNVKRVQWRRIRTRRDNTRSVLTCCFTAN